MTEKTHFGFKTVDKKQKSGLVQNIFTTVAPKYDVMNDVMSFGMQRLWKKELIKEVRPYEGEVLLDVAGGTGDIANLYLQAGGGKATVCDLNKEMLAEGQKKFAGQNIEWRHADAENLPFENNQFDYYTISFGIRNVTNIDKALKEAYRVLKPGGKFACLELSQVDAPLLKKFYDFYSFKVIPKVGQIIAGEAEPYQYLVESIRKFPKPANFENMIEQAGFAMVSYRPLTFGVVCIHMGYKLEL